MWSTRIYNKSVAFNGPLIFDKFVENYWMILNVNNQVVGVPDITVLWVNVLWVKSQKRLTKGNLPKERRHTKYTFLWVTISWVFTQTKPKGWWPKGRCIWYVNVPHCTYTVLSITWKIVFWIWQFLSKINGPN